MNKPGGNMSRIYAIRERDGTIHAEADRRGALRSQRAYGGMVVTQAGTGGERAWKPYKRHRVFLWVFLAVQAVFIIWLITGLAARTGPTGTQVAQFCGNGSWRGVFSSYADCVRHGATGLADAADIGKGIGAGIVVVFWVIADFLLAVTYGIYRLARR